MTTSKLEKWETLTDKEREDLFLIEIECFQDLFDMIEALEIKGYALEKTGLVSAVNKKARRSTLGTLMVMALYRFQECKNVDNNYITVIFDSFGRYLTSETQNDWEIAVSEWNSFYKNYSKKPKK